MIICAQSKKWNVNNFPKFGSIEEDSDRLVCSGGCVKVFESRYRDYFVSSVSILLPFVENEEICCELNLQFLNSSKDSVVSISAKIESFKDNEEDTEVIEALLKKKCKKTSVRFGSKQHSLSFCSTFIFSVDRQHLKEISINHSLNVSSKVYQGQEAVVRSSPFLLTSPALFFDTVSKGIVSAVINSSKTTLLLTDCRTLPGSEGSPFFVIDEGTEVLAGLVLPEVSLYFSKVGNFPFTFILPISSVTHRLSQSLPSNVVGSNFSDGIVLLKCGKSWGSGILVNSNLVITCAHLFTRSKTVEVIAVDGETASFSKVLFVSKGPVDVAAVRVRFSTSKKLCKLPRVAIDLLKAPVDKFVERYSINNEMLKQGMKCFSSGFSIFEAARNINPVCVVSTGCLSKIVSIETKSKSISGSFLAPCLLQSSAMVNRGQSGGVLLSEEGVLLGMVTSNSKTSDGEIIPNVNFSIPINQLLPLIYVYSEGRASTALESKVLDLYSRDFGGDILKKLWSLNYLPPVIKLKSSL